MECNMNKILLVSAVALSGLLVPAEAFAQEGAVPGAIGGAAAGAVIGGPVGAVVGGVAGATVGAAATPPAEVRTYVMHEDAPSVRVEREVVVGSELPDTVVLRSVPKYETYSYAVVNDRRVIVEAKTRKVVQIVE
jgi:hypothetical protein